MSFDEKCTSYFTLLKVYFRSMKITVYLIFIGMKHFLTYSSSFEASEKSEIDVTHTDTQNDRQTYRQMHQQKY